MSLRLISLSPDLKRLREDGYDVSIAHGHLVVRDVPYVNAAKQVCRGILVSELALAGDKTSKPSSHVAMFAGEFPCDRDGRPLEYMRHQSGRNPLGEGLVTDHSFSRKPPNGYEDYHHKVSTYVDLIARHARAIDPKATPHVYPVVAAEAPDSVFKYEDTASARAKIGDLNRHFQSRRIAIVGLGGTGSYILDLVAKTPVVEIHLFDGDRFLQHNAFRSPGAALVDELTGAPEKAEYWARVYSRMRHGVVPHSAAISDANVQELERMSYVFLCIDNGPARKLIAEALERAQIPYLDVGMGLVRDEERLGGILRVTSFQPGDAAPPSGQGWLPYGEPVDNEYSTNIQIADLNALNAALAVVKWKKTLGFYRDLEGERQALYTIDGNDMTNGAAREHSRTVQS